MKRSESTLDRPQGAAEFQETAEFREAAGFQEAAMTLALDAGSRAKHAGRPEALRERFPHSGADANWLVGAGTAELERFARGLLGKRWSEVRGVLELSSRVSPHLGALYRGWLSTHPASAASHSPLLSPGAREAERALEPMCHALGAHPLSASYAGDLLRFEVLARCSSEDHVPRTLRTRIAVHAWWASLRRGVLPFDPPAQPMLYLFADQVRWSPAT
jgi:hypothetical protein